MFLLIPPAAEEPHFNVRAANTEGFLAIHCVPDGFAGVLLGPHAGQSGRVLQTHVHRATRQDPGKAVFDGSVDLAVTTIEVVVTVRTAGVVRVGGGPNTELVWVVAPDILHSDAVFQRLAAKTAVNVIHSADIRRKTQQIAIKLITSELVVGGKQGVSLRGTLDLLNLNQAFVAVTGSCPGSINRASEAV